MTTAPNPISAALKPGKASPKAKSGPKATALAKEAFEGTVGKAKPSKKRAAPAKAPVAAAPAQAKAEKKLDAQRAAKVAEKAKGGKRAEALAAAQRGELPAAPDFSADTHKRHRSTLEKLVAMVAVGDVKGLKAEDINPVSSSRQALDKYRNLAVIALEARNAPAGADPI